LKARRESKLQTKQLPIKVALEEDDDDEDYINSPEIKE